jgi:hypothetical protein
MSSYYSFVAGLPDVSLETIQSSLTVEGLKEEFYREISSKDQKMLNLFFLQYDNANILALLKNKDASLNPNGVYPAEEWTEYIKEVQEVDEPEISDIPDYFAKFISAYLAEQPLFENLLWEDQLSVLYYDYAMKKGTPFISAWFELNLNLNNILAGLKARELKMDLQTVIVGDNEVAETLRTSSQMDFGLNQVIDYYPQIVRINEEPHLQEREYKLDLFKWNWLEEQTFFEYFSIDKVFAYLLQVSMIERWLQLDVEKGKLFFNKMVQEMTQQASDKLKDVNDNL